MGIWFFAAYVLSAGTLTSETSMVSACQTRPAIPAASTGHFYRKCIYIKHTHIARRHTGMGVSCILTSTHTHIQMQRGTLREQPYCIYLLESSPVKISSNRTEAISPPCADVHAQTLSPGFLCCAVFRGERTWSVSQIYHIPGLYPDPFNEVSNVSVHVSISSGMSDK